MALQITYSGTNERLIAAVNDANHFLTGGGLINLLSTRESPFKGTTPSDLAPTRIGELFNESSLTLALKLYDGPNNVNGAFRPKEPFNLYYNSKKIGRQACAIASTLIHESIHALDFSLSSYAFGHSSLGRDEPGYQNRAPYWIGDNAQDQLCGSSLITDPQVQVEVEWIDESKDADFIQRIVAE